MISSSVMVTAAPAATTTATSSSEPSTSALPGFDLAMAAAQSDSQASPAAKDTAAAAPNKGVVDPPALDALSDMLVSAVVPEAAACANPATGVDRPATDDADSIADATESADENAAAILAQMLAGSTPPARVEETAAAPAAVQSVAAASAQGTARSGVPAANTLSRKVASEGTDDLASSGDDGAGEPAAIAVAAAAPIPDASIVTDAAAQAVRATDPAPTTGNTAPTQSAAAQAVSAAATALRDAVAPPPQAAVHATLREPVGTARWADELGNRLVLMSVRGQQQGSLTLTPEHLGPLEVQISVSRDTANVWFGAQHADTRAALADAMPRLRELLASSGLSLGQSGVSEQAPREGFAAALPNSATGFAGSDSPVIEKVAAPAWRIWQPGFIDTYA